MRGNLTQRRTQLREHGGLRERRERAELVVREPAQRVLEQRAQRHGVARHESLEPLLAASEQSCEQRLELLEVVEHAREHAYAVAELAVGCDGRDDVARGAAIVVARVVDDRRGCDAVREHGQLLREPGVEGVERVDPQPVRLREQRPIALGVACDRSVRERERRASGASSRPARPPPRPRARGARGRASPPPLCA